MSSTRVIGILLAALALVIALVPQFTNCEATGSMKDAAGGATAPMPMASESAAGSSSAGTNGAATVQSATASPKKMKCYWTAHSEIAVAVPLFGVAVLLLLSRRKESRRALSITGMLLGVSTLLLPTVLIGACMADTASCRTTMKPTLLAAGGAVLILSLLALVLNELKSGE
jgi:hypothetical protein